MLFSFFQFQVDVETLNAIYDATLSRYVGRLGDRVSLRNHFARDRTGSRPTAPPRKQQLFALLQAKMENKKSDEDTEHPPSVSRRKRERVIELGWVHNMRQVRKITGGGTRKCPIDINCRKEEILKVAISLFFPDGQSKLGPFTDFQSDLLDFKQTPFPDNVTVGECYEKYKTGTVSFYLHTSNRAEEVDHLPDIAPLSKKTNRKRKQIKTPLPSSTFTAACSATTALQQPSPPIQIPDAGIATAFQSRPTMVPTTNLALHAPAQSIEPPVATPTLTSTVSSQPVGATGTAITRPLASPPNSSPALVITVASSPSIVATSVTTTGPTEASTTPGPPSLQSSHEDTSDVIRRAALSSEIIDNDTSVPDLDMDYILGFPTIAPLTAKSESYRIVRIHRINIHKDMLDAFKRPEILEEEIKFRYIGERGQDESGVSRDAYASFWKQFCDNHAEGEDERVPAICPDYGQEEWLAIGRVLVKGFLEHKVFPLQLSETFFCAMLFGEESVSHSLLLKSYRLYLSGNERAAIDNALSGEMNEDDKEIFTDILDREGSHTLPSDPEQVHFVVLQLAHKVLLQDPSYALETMRRVVTPTLTPQFSGIGQIREMYENLAPTPKKVIDIIDGQPMTKEENQALKFFHQYIRSQTKKSLGHLLHFLTGSFIMSVDKIGIRFVHLSGAARQPVAHTCGPCLELPNTYGSYREFRSEWESVLNSGYLRMDFE